MNNVLNNVVIIIISLIIYYDATKDRDWQNQG